MKVLELFGISIHRMLVTPQLWCIALFGLCAAAIFCFSALSNIFIVSMLLHYAIMTFISLWVACHLMCEWHHKHCSLVASFVLTCTRAVAAWRFFIWIFLLEFLLDISEYLPKYYDEQRALYAFLLLFAIVSTQYMLNFVCIPLIADNVTHFKNLLKDALYFFKKYFFTIIAILFSFLIFGIIIFTLFGCINILLMWLGEKIFHTPSVRIIMKVVFFESFLIIINMLLTIAETFFYLDSNKAHVKE